MTAQNRGLGRGLSALIPGSASRIYGDSMGNRIIDLPISKIIPNKNQPRQNFNEESLNELAESIRAFGVIQPIIVRSAGKGDMYEIISGERRYKAAKKLNFSSIPGIINQGVDDISSLEMALIENIQRDNLTPIELSHTFKQLIEEFKLTHEELSKRIGKSRAAITNYLRLLLLPLEVQKLIAEEKISAGHARALLGIEDKQKQIQLGYKIIEDDLSVRTIERLVKKIARDANTSKQVKPGKLMQFEKLPEIETAVSDYLEVPVSIKVGKKKGKIEISFGSVKEFEKVVNKIIGRK
ncbi:MAG: ParB/RepB/Spo0J family partition protein [Actinobacteria bacterium]|nr:ParB/RepB/Spo0J family partition protein [Actinomycetota bacterium]MBM3712263.1 ParB/RepB/Spo0J family partition protein [Actinomycetota bacterium]